MKILFLCTGNSCRSQMAEGFAKHIGQDFWEIKSAGLEARGVNPIAIQVMKEIGIDISKQKSTQITDEVQWADLVITLCGHADEHCPMLPARKEKRHYPFDDPAQATGNEQEIMTKFRAVRDEIGQRINQLLEELKPKNNQTLRL